MTEPCPHCGQPMPEQARRDPPLPPLDFPAIVTIHDLPADARSKAEVELLPLRAAINGLPCAARRLADPLSSPSGSRPTGWAASRPIASRFDP
jgi:hypothetical protein